MPTPWGPAGPTSVGPQYNKSKLAGQVNDFKDLEFGFNPRQYVDRLWDFDGELTYDVQEASLFVSTSNADTSKLGGTNGDVSQGFFVVQRSGYLLSATIVAEDTLVANDTNFQTFALTNLLGAGAGSTAMLAATDANTTKATGGSDLTALVPRTLTLNGTAANLRVNAGDVLRFTATATQAPTVSDAPKVRLVFATISRGLTPIVARTAGAPLVGPVANTANGEAIAQLSATNEVNTAGWTFGDQVTIPANRVWMFEALVKVATVGANERVIIGMASGYTATWDSIAQNAWFRLEGSMALLAETDDATTDNDDQATGITLTANTYYLFRIYKKEDGTVNFYVQNLTTNENWVIALTAAAFAVTHLLQPIVAVQKASGTGTPSVTCDMVRVIGARN